MLGDSLFNFWQDDVHVRGIWRRTSVEGFRSPHVAWETRAGPRRARGPRRRRLGMARHARVPPARLPAVPAAALPRRQGRRGHPRVRPRHESFRERRLCAAGSKIERYLDRPRPYLRRHRFRPGHDVELGLRYRGQALDPRHAPRAGQGSVPRPGFRHVGGHDRLDHARRHLPLRDPRPHLLHEPGELPDGRTAAWPVSPSPRAPSSRVSSRDAFSTSSATSS